MGELKTFTGGCHCGAVKYEVTTDLGYVIDCNCSMCSKKGHVLAFVTPDRFKLLSGEGAMTDYQFNKHVIHHLFCKTCGIASYATGRKPDGAQMYSVNVRCLDGADLSKLEIQ